MDVSGKSSCDSSSSLSSSDSFRGRHRQLFIERRDGSFGFSIQSYGIQYCRQSDVDIITYIDHVEPGGPAELAGMLQGDVIMSINGQNMEECDHQALVNSIRLCPNRLCVEVTFEDCVRKVRLHMRYIQLQRQLNDRMLALEQLTEHEKYFLDSLRGRSNSSASLGLSKFALGKFAASSRSRAVSFSSPLKTSRWPPLSSRHVQPTARRPQHPVCVWQSQTPALSWDNICQLAYVSCDQFHPPRAAVLIAESAGGGRPDCPVSACLPLLPLARSMENLMSSSQFDASNYMSRRSSETCLSPPLESTDKKMAPLSAASAKHQPLPSDTRSRWLKRCGMLRIKSSECISSRLPSSGSDGISKGSQDVHKLNTNGSTSPPITTLPVKDAKPSVTLTEV